MEKTKKMLVIIIFLIFGIVITTASIAEEASDTINTIYLKDGTAIDCDIGWVEKDTFYYRKYGGTIGISLKTVDIDRTYKKYREKKEEAERQPMVRQPQEEAESKVFIPSPRDTPKKQTGAGPFDTLIILFFLCAVLYGAWKIISRATSLIKRHIPPIWLIANSSLIGMVDSKQYHELEALRKEFQISSKHFPLLVYTSSNLGTKIIKRDYKSLKKLYPNKNEKYIPAKLLYNDMMSDPDLHIDEDKIPETIGHAMEAINTLDELSDFISRQEYLKNPDFYDSILGQRIEEIIGV